ncbi:sulfatase-like hydrolase/transferase [Tunicatimonas pelagia]|uniref:sulfatase-like hydrolase/transferase n=1 Tax=Tunicatimonas pelagia TaxID=931531 RepID=UPI002666F66E|nr:sulfatase-like hydrolase/transferase [Tunicatimonas pelagia]WKN40970.1 sulfatase-like hydrolase/transferase [Tunicatimonas pelagia]
MPISRKKLFSRSLLSILSLLVLASLKLAEADNPEAERPNVVLIFLDDGAFDDFAPFGNPRYPTPHVETLAKEGRSFYSFYVPQAICSASRAALLTGCYPGRTKVFGAHGPKARGLDPKFATLGEVLQQNGYRTAAFGKWHIGDQEDTRPHNRGFDETCGLMYSNDMWLHHPENPEYWGQWPLQYWENGEVTIDTVQIEDQKMLTTWYTEQAVDFIERSKDEPFFVYVPHSMPHAPIFCSDKFAGKSETGLYGNVMMEVDWSIGQIHQAIKDQGLEANTLFIFIASDNGPWLSYGDHAGITRFREGKGTSFDGGLRNPCIIKYPDEINPNTISHHAFSSIDILPTVCHLTSTDLPENTVDGKNVWDLITHQDEAKNPHDYYAFTNGKEFQGVISGDGKWKLHLPHQYRTVAKGGKGGMPGKYVQAKIDTALFNLVHDPYEKSNALEIYPEVAQQMIEYAEKHKKMFFDE